MRHGVTLGCVFLLLAGCGDSKSSEGPGSASGERPRDGSKSLTPNEMADALRKMSGAGAANEDLRRVTQEMTEAFTASMGGAPEEVAARAKAMGERPLTAQDLETYLALRAAAREMNAKPPEWQSALAARGLLPIEFSLLSSRIMAARMALRYAPKDPDPRLAQDMETLRPFVARLDGDAGAK